MMTAYRFFSARNSASALAIPRRCRMSPVLLLALVTALGAHAQTVTATVTSGTQPFAIGINPVTNKVYVSNVSSNSVTVIDGATTTTATVAAGKNPLAIAVNPVTNKVYVANYSSNNVTVIDGATNATATVATGTQPFAIAVNPVTNKVYVANYDSANVTVI